MKVDRRRAGSCSVLPMWLPGHLAVSFLICLPLLLYVRKDRTMALVYVAFFAVLLDFLHFGDLRMISHSFLGLAIILFVILGVLWVAFRPRPALLAIAVLASSAHLLVDFYIGSIFPTFPFSTEWIQLHEFNSTFDIQVEVLLCLISAILFLFLFNPRTLLVSTKNYSPRERTEALVLTVPFVIMIAAEGGYFFLTSFEFGSTLTRTFLLLAFLVPFLLTATLTIYLLVQSSS